MNNEFTSIKLTELLDSKEIKQLHILIKKNEWDNIKLFLNEDKLKDKLLKKGTTVDFILTDPPYGEMLSKKRTGQKKKKTGVAVAGSLDRAGGRV